ncbi:MAG: hypothetical protein MRY21_04690 [Simkaniaceae bacterium]|nr:hypothetical protein [Simkaniaceae bacterium]
MMASATLATIQSTLPPTCHAEYAAGENYNWVVVTAENPSPDDLGKAQAIVEAHLGEGIQGFWGPSFPKELRTRQANVLRDSETPLGRANLFDLLGKSPETFCLDLGEETALLSFPGYLTECGCQQLDLASSFSRFTSTRRKEGEDFVVGCLPKKSELSFADFGAGGLASTVILLARIAKLYDRIVVHCIDAEDISVAVGAVEKELHAMGHLHITLLCHSCLPELKFDFIVANDVDIDHGNAEAFMKMKDRITVGGFIWHSRFFSNEMQFSDGKSMIIDMFDQNFQAGIELIEGLEQEDEFHIFSLGPFPIELLSGLSKDVKRLKLSVYVASHCLSDFRSMAEKYIPEGCTLNINVYDPGKASAGTRPDLFMISVSSEEEQAAKAPSFLELGVPVLSQVEKEGEAPVYNLLHPEEEA